MGYTLARQPVSNKKAKLAIIHIAKKELGLSDENYRVLLYAAAKVSSAAELKYEYQFNDVMTAFERAGFKTASRKKPRPKWSDEWGGTSAQRAKREAMWRVVARNPADEALRLFIKRVARVDHPRFLRAYLAQKGILALESMMKKVGYGPKTGKRIEQ